MTTTVALIGAGGKMGCRITDRLKGSAHRVLYVERGERGRENLVARGLRPVSAEEAVPQADFVVLAVPDNRMDVVSAALVPLMKRGAMAVFLDPAAPCAGKLHRRDDVSFFASHPCHPPVFNDETDPEARRDFFGGIKAKQHIVCALIQGPEEDYEKGAAFCREIFAPVMTAYRVTVEQMAILEPALSESTSAPCVWLIKQGLDEAVRRGVPAEAARAFVLGHLNIQLAITFGEIDARYSDGALKALQEAQSVLFKPDWNRTFEPETIRASLESITRPPEK